MGERSKFTGGDQEYLRTKQYVDSTKLAARAALHARFSTAETTWFAFVGERIELRADAVGLEVGCGAGWLWADDTWTPPAALDITLTDLSAGMVEEAVERVASSRPGWAIRGEVADAQDLPFEAGGFDRVVANHMLYHVPDPQQAVAELARVVADDGVVVVATNGARHLRELWEIRSAVFGGTPVDATSAVFGPDNGFAMLRERFDEVGWTLFPDELRCTDPEAVLAYFRTAPPGEDADDEQLRLLAAEIDARFDDSGVLRVTKETGCFVCRGPRR